MFHWSLSLPLLRNKGSRNRINFESIALQSASATAAAVAYTGALSAHHLRLAAMQIPCLGREKFVRREADLLEEFTRTLAS